MLKSGRLSLFLTATVYRVAAKPGRAVDHSPMVGQMKAQGVGATWLERPVLVWRASW